MATLSLAMIVRNEADRLGHCLDSVRGLVDEIVVVDTGSTDATTDLIRARGAKLSHLPWPDDFSAARNESLRHCTGDWVLILDADEAIDIRDHHTIRAVLAQDRIPAYRLTLRNYYSGGSETVQGVAVQMNETSYSEGSQFSHYADGKAVRLCRRLPGLSFKGRIHELLEPYFQEHDLPVRDLPAVIHHFGKADRQRESAKRTYYLELAKTSAAEDPKNPGLQFNLLQQAMVAEAWPVVLEAASASILLLGVESVHPLALLGAGLALQFSDRHSEALGYLDGLLRRDPLHSQGLTRRAVSLAALGRLDEARESLKKAIEVQPGFIVPYVNLAELESQSGRYQPARKAILAGLQVCPRDPKLRHALIQLGISHGDLDQAVQDAWAAIAQCPDGGQGVWHRLVAFHLIQKGARQQALDVLDLGLATFEDQPDLQRLRSLAESIPSSI